MIQAILGVLSAVVTIYTMLCLVDIILSWFPGAKYTNFGRAISKLCDPYLNFFSRYGWLRFGNIDFSPIISIGLLSAVSSILAGINSSGRIYLGGILGTILYMLWNIVSSLLGILLLVVFIRWIVLVIKKGQTGYDSAWLRVDEMIRNISFKISSTFVKASVSYQKSLLITWIVLAVIMFIGRIFIFILINLCNSLPF